jgi:hypothetical protein
MSVIPESSDMFSFMLARSINKVDYGGSLVRNVDAVWRFAEKSGLAEKWALTKCRDTWPPPSSR